MEFFLVLKDTLLCLAYFILIAFSSKCNYKGDKGVCGLLTKKTGCWQSTVLTEFFFSESAVKSSHREMDCAGLDWEITLKAPPLSYWDRNISSPQYYDIWQRFMERPIILLWWIETTMQCIPLLQLDPFKTKNHFFGPDGP